MGLPNQNQSVNAKEQIEASKKITDAIKSTTAPLQNLAAIAKGIKLNLIDPKDQQRLEQLLAVISKTGFSNWTELNKILKLSVRDLVKYKQEVDDINKLNEKQLENEIKRDKISEDAFKRLKKTTKTYEEQHDLLDKLKNLEGDISELLLDRIPVLSTFNSKMDQLSDIQKGVLSSNSLLNKSYQDIASNASTSFNTLLSEMESAEVPNIVGESLDFSNELIETLIESVDAGIDHIIQSFDKIDANDALERLTATGKLASQVLNSSFDQLIQGISEKGKIGPELAEKIVTDMKNKMTGLTVPSMLTPQEAAEVEKLFADMSAAGDASFQSLIVLAANAARKHTALTKKIDALNNSLENVSPKLITAVKGFSQGINDGMFKLQATVNSFMPNWLSQTLGIDDAFNSITQGVQQAGSKMISTILATGSITKGLGVAFKEINATILANPIGLLVAGAGVLLSLLISSEQSMVAMSEKFGISRDRAKEINGALRQMNASSGSVLVTQESLTSVLTEHEKMYGRILDMNDKANQEALKFAGALGRQYGVSAGEVYGMSQQFQMMGADQTLAENLTAWTAKASDLAGIPFKNIVKDLAESSQEIALYFDGMPEKAAKSVVQIQRMGMTLKGMGKIMDKSLNISGFIKDMTELNIMTRGSANLGDFFKLRHTGASPEKLAEEIAKQYDNMVASGQNNEYNMRKFAEATGESVENLQKGHQIRKLEGKLSKEQLEVLQRHMDKVDMKTLQDEKSAAMLSDQLTSTEKMDAAMNKITADLKSAFLPIAEELAVVFDGLGPMVESLTPAFKFLAAMIKGMLAPIQFISKLFTDDWATAVDSVKKSFGEYNGPLSLIKWLAVGIGSVITTWWAVGKAKSFFGIVSAGFKGISSTAGSLKDTIMSVFGKKSAADAGKVTDTISDSVTGKKPSAPALPDNTKSKGVLDSFKNINTTDLIKGAAAIAILAGALWIAAKGFQEFAEVKWEAVALGVGGILGLAAAAKIVSNGSTDMIKGAIAIGILGAALIPAAYAFNMLGNVNWDSVKYAGVTLGVLAGAAIILGAASSYVFLGAGAIAALGASLIPLGYGLNLAAPGMAEFAKIVAQFGPIITAVFDGLSGLVSTFASSIAFLISTFASLEPAKLFAAATGIGAIGIALAGFGSGSAFAGIGSAIGEFFGGDPIEKLTKLGELGPKLLTTSTSVRALKTSISEFLKIDYESLNSISSSIIELGNSLSTLGTGSAIEGLGSAVGELFGSSPIQKLTEFAALGPGIDLVATAINNLASSLTNLTNSVSNLEVDKLQDIKIPALTAGPSNIVASANESFAAIDAVKGTSTAVVTNPVNSAVTRIPEPLKATSANSGFDSEYMTGGGTNANSASNVNNTLKQLISAFNSFAQRPVIVQIGDMELRSLNRTLKQYNNK